MKVRRSTNIVIFMSIILTGCVESIPCSEIWRYRGMPEYEALAKKCPAQAQAAEDARKGTFKKSEPREW